MNDRAHWLEERKLGIGGSDAAAVLGLSPWKTPLELYLEKRGEIEDTRQTVAMEWGTLIEPAIVEMYRRRKGGDIVVQTSQRAISPTHDFMRCNMDGLAMDPTNRRPWIVEAKLASSDEEWGEPGTDQVPSQYIPQAQHMLAVTGFEVVEFAVLFARFGLRELQTYVVPRDDELIGMLTAQEAEFWQRVLDGNPPEPTTPAEVRLRWPSDTGGAIEADETIVAAVDLLRQAKDDKKVAEAREADMAMAVQRYMTDAAELTYHGATLCTWRKSKDSRYLDKEALAAAHPSIVEKFTSTRPGNRPLLLKKG